MCCAHLSVAFSGKARLVRSWGGEAYAIEFLHDRSTTKLLTKVRQQR